jgi:hypothetical protein
MPPSKRYGLTGTYLQVSALPVQFANFVNSKDEVSTYARLPLSNSPVTSVTSNDIRCNAGTVPVIPLCTVDGKSHSQTLALII